MYRSALLCSSVLRCHVRCVRKQSASEYTSVGEFSHIDVIHGGESDEQSYCCNRRHHAGTTSFQASRELRTALQRWLNAYTSPFPALEIAEHLF